MKANKVSFMVIGGLVAAGVVIAYKYVVGRRYRQRATAPKNEEVDKEEDPLLDEMVLEEEDD
jgi:hypothetical protein